jgi:hypothetical protein
MLYKLDNKHLKKNPYTTNKNMKVVANECGVER